MNIVIVRTPKGKKYARVFKSYIKSKGVNSFICPIKRLGVTLKKYLVQVHAERNLIPVTDSYKVDRTNLDFINTR